MSESPNQQMMPAETSIEAADQAPRASDLAVIADRVSLAYRPRTVGRGWLPKLLSNEAVKPYWALKDVSFELERGHVLGVVGRNGCGKSTLSRLITGVIEPDMGSITANGRVSLLTIGTGFRPDLTGRDNVIINGAYLGFPTDLVKEKLPEIVAFAELEDHIDTPLRQYSSGMRARLGFAIATTLTPEILVIDEGLAAGDRIFRRKARERIHSVITSSITVIIVAHETKFLQKTCDQVLWLDNGHVRMQGEAREVLDAYSAYCDGGVIDPANDDEG